MEPIGIEGIINRINQIEARFNQLTEQPPASFQEVLGNTMSKVQPPAGQQTNLLQPPNNYWSAYGIHPPAGINSPVAAYDLFNISPNQMVKYKGYNMTQATSGAFSQLESLIAERFPGREITITSTTDGQHLDANHKDGKAVDFVVDRLTKDESFILEELTRQAGFTPYNEYIHSSPYKTGDHMHVDLAG